MIALEKSTKYCFYTSVVVMSIFLLIKLLVVFNIIPMCDTVMVAELVCFLLFIPLFSKIIHDYVKKNKESVKLNYYAKNLNEVLISQSHNHLFYEGKVVEGAKLLTKEVTETISADRCSIWLYNEDKTSIICEQLYIKCENTWYTGIELFKKDYERYFDGLIQNPVIVADDVNTHPHTMCFKESYSDPLGIKSMLDVPIVYRGEVIGVICIESLTKRNWHKVEVNFAEMLSSLYSFAYSVEENKIVEHNLLEFEQFVNETALVSRTDKFGNILYANDKFIKTCGYGLDEVIGKNHRIVNSGQQPIGFWSDMYKTTLQERKTWNNLVINKRKDGVLYYVDTFIKAEFDPITDEHTGFISIRQDVSELVETLNEINKKNSYLEHASKILRHDMNSGINIYIPRGLSSLERRLNPEIIEEYRLESPLKMISEGLRHSQKVYKGVYEFTNLVKADVCLEKHPYDLKDILNSFLSSTAYSSQVVIDQLPIIDVNESLFCTAIDNLIRNGLKYNDSETKLIAISMFDEEHLMIQDNGRGMTQEEFELYSHPYSRKQNQKESGSGLGLNICLAILKEHGFSMTCEKNEIGTKMLIKIK